MGYHCRSNKKEVGQWDFKIAKVCKAYSWTYDYATSLPLNIFEKFFKCIEIIEAQDFLKECTISSWSDLKKEDRDRIRRSMHRKAFPKTWDKDKAVTMSELESILTSGG